MPEIPNDILYKIIRERIDKWDELLLEQMTHLSVNHYLNFFIEF